MSKHYRAKWGPGTGGMFVLGGVAIFLIAGMGLMWRNGAASPPPESESAGALVAANSSYDFGTIPMGEGVVKTAYAVTNTGSEPVRIWKVYTSCMCTTAIVTDAAGKRSARFGMPGHVSSPSRADIVVGPGETVSVESIFDPAAHGPSGVGIAKRSIYLETDSRETPKLALDFRAVVTR